MQRYLFGLACAVVVVLGVFLAADCGETGGIDGGGGSAGGGGSGGVAGAGGMPECESAEDCDDGNECTEDACNPSSGSCERTAIHDGVSCELELVFTAEQEDVLSLGEWGVYHMPDEHISYFRAYDTYHVWFTAARDAHHFISNDLLKMVPTETVDGTSVAFFGPSGDGFDAHYAGPGSVMHASNGQDLLMFYHGEDQSFEGPSGFGWFYSTIGLARSSDQGKTWVRMGAVITGMDPKPATPTRKANGAGLPCALVNEGDGFIYLYYIDWPTHQGPVADPDAIHVARSPISSDGVPGSWRKYFQGEFDEPGLSGNSDGVIRGPHSGALWSGFPSVSFNVFLDSYLAVFQAVDGFYYSTSRDRVNWGVGKKLLHFEEPTQAGDPWYAYPSLLSPSQPNDMSTDEVGYLYYGFGSFNAAHYMVRRPVDVRWVPVEAD